MNTLKNRLREPSTWAGLAGLIAMGAQAAATKDPQAIAGVLASLLAMVMPEKKA